ncbi:hypothetical protein ACSNOB_15700 [Micromonospora sp. URMC 106]|uniref:hypothetical protein n=1 Tax=Micromonospora sp. URMC 106 TaxID=3423408 RepID=UPI003F1DEE9E
MAERFLTAALGGDLRGLMAVLALDVTLWTDGGGKGPATSLHPVHGRDAVARLFVAVAAGVPAGLDIRYRPVNGDPAAILFERGARSRSSSSTSIPNKKWVRGVFSVTNPDKLSRVGG